MPSFGVMNRLANEKSPYLLQHAANPVDWYPWGEEAFRRARERDVPIFLSIGYATCHWCHVMEHGSFEDREVADTLNSVFVSIKVDREERPDVDEQYMTVCTLLTGSGGWPLTLILTPDTRPFYAATYLSKPALLDLIGKVNDVWTHRRADVEKSAGSILAALKDTVKTGGAGDLPDAGVLARAFSELLGAYDEEHGGFGGAPKFPTPHNITFLLRYHRRTRDARALRMADETLTAMRRGGLYDHVGYGFHRYSTDERWLVPHFEKMLYDQALLALAYLEAAEMTGNRAHADTAADVLDYVGRDLGLPEGGFASAEDADSEGVEGKFYVWSRAELETVLPPAEMEVLTRLSAVSAGGNYRDPFGHESSNILHLPTEGSEELPRAIRESLVRRRGERVRPLRDDKILADWNGLAIAALAVGARVTGHDRFLSHAREAAGFVLTRMRANGGRLLHRYREGVAAIPAFAPDYAYMVWGLLELYDATLEPEHLGAARELAGVLLEDFVVAEGAGQATLYLTARDAETLLVRPRGAYDGALPSAASVAVMVLYRLARLTGSGKLEDTARALLRGLSEPLERHPRGLTFLLGSLDYHLGPSHEVVVVGAQDAPDTRALVAAVRGARSPGTVLLHRPPGDAGVIDTLAPFTRGMTPQGGRATAYVCRNHTCDLPTTDPAVVARQLAT